MDLIDPWICKSCDLNVGRIIRESQYGDNILSFKLNFTKIMWNKGCVLGFTDFVWLLLSTMIIDILTWGNFRSSAEAASTDAFFNGNGSYSIEAFVFLKHMLLVEWYRPFTLSWDDCYIFIQFW